MSHKHFCSPAAPVSCWCKKWTQSTFRRGAFYLFSHLPLTHSVHTTTATFEPQLLSVSFVFPCRCHSPLYWQSISVSRLPAWHVGMIICSFCESSPPLPESSPLKASARHLNLSPSNWCRTCVKYHDRISGRRRKPGNTLCIEKGESRLWLMTSMLRLVVR